MIGYYVHHQGRGHLHRAQALAQALTRTLDEPVAGLSSLARPREWTGPWVDLPMDDLQTAPHDVTAGGQLHWAPVGDPGLRARSAAVSGWVERARPRLVVVDVSVEVALLVRLHGVPVVSAVLPGPRTDASHLFAMRAATALVAFSPGPADDFSPGVPDDITSRVTSIGAVSRFPPSSTPVGRSRSGTRRPHVVVLQGRGGGALTSRTSAELTELAPRWRWTVLGGADGWVDDVSSVLTDADVVVTNAGQGSIADVAAHRRPAVVIPADRPFREQETTAAVLSSPQWPALVLSSFPDTAWEELLDRAISLDGAAWERWYDGRAPERFTRLVEEHASPAAREAQPA